MVCPTAGELPPRKSRAHPRSPRPERSVLIDRHVVCEQARYLGAERRGDSLNQQAVGNEFLAHSTPLYTPRFKPRAGQVIHSLGGFIGRADQACKAMDVSTREDTVVVYGHVCLTQQTRSSFLIALR